MAEKFGEVILAVKANDEQLKGTLQRDETLVTTSVSRMQGTFDGLTASTKQFGTASTQSFDSASKSMNLASLAAGRAGMAVAGLGQAATVTGSAAVAASAQVGALGYTISTLFVGLSAKLAIIAGAFGVIAALVGAIFARQKIADWIEGVGDIEATLAETEARLQAINEAREKQIQLLRQQIAIEGGTRPSHFGATPGIRRLMRQLEDAKTTRMVETAEVAAWKVQADRIRALDQELDILTGVKTKYDFIADAAERTRTIERDRLSIQKQLAQAADAEAQARSRAAGPQTFQEALQLVRETHQLMQLQARSGSVVEMAVENYARRQGLSSLDKASLLQAAGIPAGETIEGGVSMPRSGGAIPGGAFTSTRVRIAQPTTQTPEAKKALTAAEKSEKHLDEMNKRGRRQEQKKSGLKGP